MFTILLGTSPFACALDIKLNYACDTLVFFSRANTFRRDIMRSAADVFENRITDELSAISKFDNGSRNFQRITPIEPPDTGAVINGPGNIPVDTVIGYVGGSNPLGMTTLGEAGPAQ